MIGRARDTAIATVLALDIGRTATRAGIFRVDSGLKAVRPEGAIRLESGASLADPDGPALVAAVTDAGVRQLSDATKIDVLVVAASGAFSRPAAASTLADALAAIVPPGTAIAVTSDVVAAHAGALHGAAGVVLIAGTGAVALAIGSAGNATLVDGGGYLIGDAGSGFAIGRAGLAAALRHRDGRPGGSPALAAAARQQLGPLDGLPGALHANAAPARTIASFVPAVAATARDGDPVAIAIWAAAVEELADTITAACRKLTKQDQRVAIGGGLFELPDLVTEPLCAVVASRLSWDRITLAQSDPLAGAASLGHAGAGIYEQLLLRRPGNQPGSQPGNRPGLSSTSVT